VRPYHSQHSGSSHQVPLFKTKGITTRLAIGLVFSFFSDYDLIEAFSSISNRVAKIAGTPPAIFARYLWAVRPLANPPLPARFSLLSDALGHERSDNLAAGRNPKQLFQASWPPASRCTNQRRHRSYVMVRASHEEMGLEEKAALVQVLTPWPFF
jgi:hypothetical protein